MHSIFQRDARKLLKIRKNALKNAQIPEDFEISEAKPICLIPYGKSLTIKKVDTLSYKTISANKATAEKGWVLVNAENMVLGRLSSEVAKVLRGKHKPNFTPHADCGDHVIIINADKVRLTGKKLTDKVYIRHTGYPGGQRFATPREVLEKNPRGVVEAAVKGMLPKNRLGRRLFTNLRVFAGPEHPHAAQQPVELKF